MHMQRLQGKLYLQVLPLQRAAQPRPSPTACLSRSQPAPHPCCSFSISYPSTQVNWPPSFSKKKQEIKKVQAFLSACGNILITIREMTTQSLDIIERLGVFLDALTGLRAWI